MGFNGRAWLADLVAVGLGLTRCYWSWGTLVWQNLILAVGCLIIFYLGWCLSRLVLAEIDAWLDLSPPVDIYFC